MSIIHDRPEIESELEPDPSAVEIPPRLQDRLQSEADGLRRVVIFFRDDGGERQIGSLTVTDTAGVPDPVDPDEVAFEIARYGLYFSKRENTTARCVARLYNKKLDTGKSKHPSSIRFSIEHPSVKSAFTPSRPKRSKMPDPVEPEDDNEDEPVGVGAALVTAVKSLGEDLRRTSENYQTAQAELLEHYRYLLHETNSRSDAAMEREHDIMLRLAGGEREEISNRALDRAIEGLIANADLYRELQTQISNQRILEQREQRKAEGSARLAQDLLQQLKAAAPIAGIALMAKMTGKPPEECAGIVAALMGGQAQQPAAAPQGPPPPSPPRPQPTPAPSPAPSPAASELIRRSHELRASIRPDQWEKIRSHCSSLQVAGLEGWLTATDDKSCLQHLIAVQQDRSLLSEFTDVVDEEQGQILMDIVDDLKARVGFVDTTASESDAEGSTRKTAKRKSSKKTAKRKSSRK